MRCSMGKLPWTVMLTLFALLLTPRPAVAHVASSYGVMDWLQGHTVMALAAGLGLIFAGAAFYLSLRNASRLRRIEDALVVNREMASRDTTFPAPEKPHPAALPTAPIQ